VHLIFICGLKFFLAFGLICPCDCKTMSPFQFLSLLLTITALAAAAQWIGLSRRRRILRELAGQWKMQYVSSDRFRLAARLAGRLPVPGAADFTVSDLLYRTDGGRRVYLFTCEFTRGVVFSQRRRRRVVAFVERVALAEGAECPALRIGQEGKLLTDQYRGLHEEI
jgi:hypothetical protein